MRSEGHAEAVANVRIESIAAGGDGVGRIGGMVCFVPRAAPGDLAQVAYVPHARYARGRLLQLLEASNERVEPRCHHYVTDRCGGCQLQHLTASAQYEVRRRIVRDALHRVGHREVPQPDLVTGESWGYRERLTLAMRQRGSTWVGGLHAFDSPSQVFALDECPVAHPSLGACWTLVRRSLRGLPTPAPGSTLRLALRLAGDDGSRQVLIVIGGTQWIEAQEWATRLRDVVPTVSAVWWEPDRLEAVLLSGDAQSSVLAFAQVNPVVASALREHVLASVRALCPTSVIDAYSGAGDIALALARDGIRVTAIESDHRATARASEQLAPYPGSVVVTGLVEESLAAALPADVVLLNPPRRGVDVRVAETLSNAVGLGVRGIVYVSCDPATLARDVSRLPQWHIASLRCFDMFPQTAHVETVCVLIPEDS